MTTSHPQRGRSPWIAPVFLPHAGCSHRCVFCNQHLISRSGSLPAPDEVRARLDRFFRARKNHPGRRAQVAFFGGSFTGMDAGLQQAYLEAAGTYLRQGQIDSIRVSARPDELSEDRLRLLRRHGVGTVEIGVQSLSDPVLQESRRGCTARDAVEAIHRTQEFGLETGAQIMVGLPGDSGAEALETAEELAGLRPDFVRVYPVVVFPQTELARRFREGRYSPLDLPGAVRLCARLLERFERWSIPVIRIGLQIEEGMETSALAGPLHPAFGFLVQSFLYRERLLRSLPEGRFPGDRARFRIHPADRPLFVGYRRETLRALQGRIGTDRITVVEDAGVSRGAVAWSAGSRAEGGAGRGGSP